MNIDVMMIRDECRANLNTYTIQAFSLIPHIDNPLILDAGCGTGVPTLALARILDGTIYAVDPDPDSISRLTEKAAAAGMSHRIKPFCASILDPLPFHETFDIVLAEGLLNVIGFEKGMSVLTRYLKRDGFLVIHDELKNDAEKRVFFEKNFLKVEDSFILNEDVWWNGYYACLEKRITELHLEAVFKKEIEELNDYKNNPQSFRSVYYILRNLKELLP